MAQFADKAKEKKLAWLCHKENPVTPIMVPQPPWSSEAVTCRFPPDHSTRLLSLRISFALPYMPTILSLGPKILIVSGHFSYYLRLTFV